LGNDLPLPGVADGDRCDSLAMNIPLEMNEARERITATKAKVQG